jgi:NADH:ubiquinone oxidoreductase subunit B-like Fe-S oxidoreductase
VAVDLHIRGCPPRTIDLIKGLLALVQRGEGSGGI